jgi:hypothetical protein
VSSYLDYGANDSGGAFYPTQPPGFGIVGLVGNALTGGYTGLTWMKNVFVLVRDYWDTGLSTPYSGQIFPTGGNSGGPGQIFPY